MVIWLTPSPSTVHVVYECPIIRVVFTLISLATQQLHPIPFSTTERPLKRYKNIMFLNSQLIGARIEKFRGRCFFRLRRSRS